MLYRIIDTIPVSAPLACLRRTAERLNTHALRKPIAAFAPDAVVCAHFLPAELLMRERARRRFNFAVHVVVTDFDSYGMRLVPDTAAYFAANDEVAFHMQACGNARGAIHATGSPDRARARNWAGWHGVRGRVRH